MTKTDQRLRKLSSGMKKLGYDNRDYIYNLVHVLLFIEQMPVCSELESKLPIKGTCPKD